MAGIGFELRGLSRQESITAVVAAAGHAAMIAAGPWLFTIFALAAISILAEDVVGLAALATFRVVVIYAFTISLVLAAPVMIVATRLVADRLWLKEPKRTRSLVLGAAVLTLALVGAVQAVFDLIFDPPWQVMLAFTAASLTVSQVWVAIGFAGAVRDYTGITLAFLAGLTISLLASLGAAVAGFGPPGMIAGFLIGLLVAELGIMNRVLHTFPTSDGTGVVTGVREILQGFRQYWHLALGSLFGTAGVWVDKWLFWISPAHETVEGGLAHAPIYDSAMFIASLSIIPALSSFLIRLETEFFERYQQYYAVIQGHGTLRQIEASRSRLAGYTLDNLTLITVLQAGIASVLMLTAPLIVDQLGLQFRQIAILRYGALGVVFQFILIASSALILYFDRRRIYLALQLFFFVSMASLTWLTIRLGEETYGVGFFLASLLTSALAFATVLSTLQRLNYLTFLGNNSSITPSAYYRRPVLRRWAEYVRNSAR